MSSTTTTPTQLHIAITALAINTLSFLRLPEVSIFLFRRWKSCRPIDAALDWVPIIDQELLPLFKDIARSDYIRYDDRVVMEKEIEKLETATIECLVLLKPFQIRDCYTESPFLPWISWPRRNMMVDEIIDKISAVREAYSACETTARKLRRSTNISSKAYVVNW